MRNVAHASESNFGQPLHTSFGTPLAYFAPWPFPCTMLPNAIPTTFLSPSFHHLHTDHMTCRPNKPKNGGITAGYTRAGQAKGSEPKNAADSSQEVRQISHPGPDFTTNPRGWCLSPTECPDDMYPSTTIHYACADL
jgi:hypothetical protein